MNKCLNPALCLQGLVLLIAIPLLNAGPPQKKGKTQAEPQEVTVSGKLPTLTPVEGTNASQSKAGITISVAPTEYSLTTGYRSKVVPIRPSFKEALIPHPGNGTYVERTCLPISTVAPDRLQFQVNVINQMPRVFHGAGLVVNFNVAGKLVATDASGYAEFANSIVPPRAQQQFQILGPRLDSIPDQTSIALFFYDVVTNVDDKGAVSEKQNFEWDFQYAVQLKEQQMEQPPPDRMWIAPGQRLPGCVVGSAVSGK